MIDPPRHDRLRALVSRVFTPRAIGALEPMIREVITGYLDQLDPSDEMDLVGGFAGPFPVEIISRMLGVPAPDRQQIRHWLDSMLTREVGEIGPSKAAQADGAAMARYFFELAAEKRAHPTDDMLSRLTQVEVADDDGVMQQLDDGEIAGFGTLIGGAGAETVTKLVGNAVVLFDRHPEQWQMVLDDPSCIPQAVEEILRYYPPSQYQGRYAPEAVDAARRHDPRRHPDDPPHRRRDPRRAGLRRPRPLRHHAASDRCRSASATASTAASAPRWRGWRAGSPSRSWRSASRATRSGRDGLERVHMANVAGYSHVPVQNPGSVDPKTVPPRAAPPRR